MTLENINYPAMLADMRAKRSALDTSIAALETALASGALGQPGEFVAGDAPGITATTIPTELPVGAFLGKSLKAAIKLYLSAVRKKQSGPEIAAALKDGGVESTSSNFEAVVKATLNNLKISGEVLRFKDGWALAEHYNQSIRKHLAEGRLQKGKRGSKGKIKNKAKSQKNKAGSVGVLPTPAESPLADHQLCGPQSVVEHYFSSHAGQEFSGGEVAVALKLRVQTVGLICAKLAHADKLEKTADGKFRMARVQKMSKAG